MGQASAKPLNEYIIPLSPFMCLSYDISLVSFLSFQTAIVPTESIVPFVPCHLNATAISFTIFTHTRSSSITYMSHSSHYCPQTFAILCAMTEVCYCYNIFTTYTYAMLAYLFLTGEYIQTFVILCATTGHICFSQTPRSTFA